MSTAQQLADALASSTESDSVRLVADWMQRTLKSADRDLTEPRLSGNRVVDALAHTPESFSHRGLFIEADSLESV